MRASPGNDRMQEIAAAIQEGAQAYLRRQYTTIAMVGVVILIAVFFLIGWLRGRRLRHRRGPVGRGRLRGHADLGARQRPHRPGAPRRAWPRACSLAFRSGAITGMLVAGFALIGVAGYFAVLTEVMGLEPDQPRGGRLAWSRWASAPR